MTINLSSAGAQGPIGPTGPTGPTGPAGTSTIETLYAYTGTGAGTSTGSWETLISYTMTAGEIAANGDTLRITFSWAIPATHTADYRIVLGSSVVFLLDAVGTASHGWGQVSIRRTGATSNDIMGIAYERLTTTTTGANPTVWSVSNVGVTETWANSLDVKLEGIRNSGVSLVYGSNLIVEKIVA